MKTETEISEVVKRTITTVKCDDCGRELSSYDYCPFCERHYCEGDSLGEKSKCYDGKGISKKLKTAIVSTLHRGYPCKHCRSIMGYYFPQIQELSLDIDRCVDIQDRLIKNWKEASKKLKVR